MLIRMKQGLLVVCLFLFLFVVIGGGLHLNPGGAFLVAATGTPLVIHVFSRRWGNAVHYDPTPSSRSPGSERSVAGAHANPPRVSEIETLVRE